MSTCSERCRKTRAARTRSVRKTLFCEEARQASAVLSADSAPPPAPTSRVICFTKIWVHFVCVLICLGACGRAAERAAESSLLLNLANDTLHCPVKKLEGEKKKKLFPR